MITAEPVRRRDPDYVRAARVAVYAPVQESSGWRSLSRVQRQALVGVALWLLLFGGGLCLIVTGAVIGSDVLTWVAAGLCVAGWVIVALAGRGVKRQLRQ